MDIVPSYRGRWFLRSYRELSRSAKILFDFFTDWSDHAGRVEGIDTDLIAFMCGLTEGDFARALAQLRQQGLVVYSERYGITCPLAAHANTELEQWIAMLSRNPSMTRVGSKKSPTDLTLREVKMIEEIQVIVEALGVKWYNLIDPATPSFTVAASNALDVPIDGMKLGPVEIAAAILLADELEYRSEDEKMRMTRPDIVLSLPRLASLIRQQGYSAALRRANNVAKGGGVCLPSASSTQQQDQ